MVRRHTMTCQDLNDYPHYCAGHWIAWAPPSGGCSLQHAEHGPLRSIDVTHNVTNRRVEPELRPHTIRNHRHRQFCCSDTFDSRL